MHLFSNQIAAKVIDHGLSKGADFVDLFVDKTAQKTISLKSSQIETINSGIDFGIGVRLIFGDNFLYAYTNSQEESDLINLINILVYNPKQAHIKSHPLQEKNGGGSIEAYLQEKLSMEEKIKYLSQLDEKSRAVDNRISQVYCSLLERLQEVEIFNSEGLIAYDKRPLFRLMTSAVAVDGNNQSSGSESPGVRGGDDFLNQISLEQVVESSTKTALLNLTSDETPAGNMPVVIDEGFGGVIFHEACGHLLETTSVEKKASVFWDKMGEQIAHENLSASDDGTIDFGWGSIQCDDEGMKTQKTQLIQNGKLTSFMVDRMGEIKTGYKRTGSARRQSYKFAPASRMRNTFIEPGKHSLDELIESMGDGLYAKKMGGGSVNPGTGEFNFSVQEGYLVKDGKILKPVKGATLIGTGPEIMPRISMVANNFSIAAGWCGSVSGSIPAAVGQPAIKVDAIRVGGRG